MAVKLFIGNIPYTWDDQKLTELFSAAGTVISARIIRDKYSGRSRGFGFIEYQTPEEAQKGIEMYNNKEVDGRQLVVNEARLPADRGAQTEPSVEN